MSVRFLVYGLLGWAMEIAWTGMGALLRQDWRLEGHTYLWMFPIYGLAVFLEPLHERIRHLPWLARGGIWALAIWVIEYASGAMLRGLLGVCPWDYRGSTPYQVHGLIRLDYLPAWFTAGLLFEQLHDWLKKRLPA